MNNKEIKTAYDNYVDATVELFVAYYSEACAERIQEEMENCSEEHAAFPAALDKRCRALIKKEDALCQRRQLWKVSKRIAKSVAIIVMVILSLTSVLFATVDAVRIPIMNFYIEQNKDYWKITSQTSEDTHETTPGIDLTDPLADIVPDEYSVTFVKGASLDQITVMYENTTGNSIFFSSQPHTSTVTLDSENAQSSQKCTIHGHNAVLVTKNGTTHIAWVNETTSTIYTFSSDQFDYIEALRIAERIAERIS